MQMKYPTIISNEKLYEISKEKPVSQTMRTARWKLFGHILRRNRNIPASEAMEYFFHNNGKKGFQGRRRTNLPAVLNKDLKRLDEQLGLETSKDLEKLREMAQNRTEWNDLVKRVERAGEAEASEDDSAKRLK